MNNRQRRVLASAALAFFTVFFLTSENVLAFPILMESSSLFCLPAMGGIAFLYWKTLFPFEKRRFIISGLTGILMGLMFLLGIRYSTNEIPAPDTFSFLAALFATSLLFSAFVSLLLLIVSSGLPDPAAGKGVHLAETRKKEGRTVLILFTATFAVYMAAFLAVYPGIYSYDASVQVLQFFGDEPVTSHHPVLHTLLLCGSLKVGEILFHSYQAGLALYSLIQVTFISVVFTFVLVRMIRRRVPFWLVFFSWLFLAANPYMQVLSLLTTKDVLFGVFFLLTFDFSIDMVSGPEIFFQNRLSQTGFFLSALFSCFLETREFMSSCSFRCLPCFSF